MTDELKPCPFCGFSPEIDEVDFLYPLTRERDVWGAHCYETGGGCGLCVVGDSKEGALKAWNRRISASITDTAGAKPVMWVILDKDGDLVGQSMTPMKGLDWEPLFRAAPPAPSVADVVGAITWCEEGKHEN